jgi:orotate phosphoribosyltransferase
MQIVGFTPHAPVTFKSGIVSPVYIDNRRLPYQPDAWHQIISAFQQTIASYQLDFDVIAGIEAAGIPHSAALAYAMHRPSVFVRKQAKEHGMKKRVEGGDVSGLRVLLIEDTVTTGGSSLSGVTALQDEGAQVITCLAIFSYGFAQATAAFAQAGVPLITLTSLEALLEAARHNHALAPEAIDAVAEWQRSLEG